MIFAAYFSVLMSVYLVNCLPTERTDMVKLDVPVNLLIGRRLVLTVEEIDPIQNETTQLDKSTDESNITSTAMPDNLKIKVTTEPTDDGIFDSNISMPIKKIIPTPDSDISHFIFDINDKCPQGYQKDQAGICRQVLKSNRRISTMSQRHSGKDDISATTESIDVSTRNSEDNEIENLMEADKTENDMIQDKTPPLILLQ